MYKYTPDYSTRFRRNRPLKGNYTGYRECHVGGEGDWLLIYKKQNNRLVLVFTATGTHADLFE